MAAGMEGFTVEDAGMQLLPPAFGQQGFTVEAIIGQYFAPVFGFVGFIVDENEAPLPLAKKTIKHF
jgi:hypothetical protein